MIHRISENILFKYDTTFNNKTRDGSVIFTVGIIEPIHTPTDDTLYSCFFVLYDGEFLWELSSNGDVFQTLAPDIRKIYEAKAFILTQLRNIPTKDRTPEFIRGLLFTTCI